MTYTECTTAIAAATGHSQRQGFALPPLFQASPCRPDRFVGAREPTLDDLLDDPILGRLLASDGVTMNELLLVVARARTALERR